MRLILLAGLLLAFELSASVPAPAHGEHLALKPCRVAGTEQTLRCGTLIVPEDRDRDGGRNLRLRVVVVPALAERPLEPVFYLAGGPGQAATDTAVGWADDPLRRDHDIVLMDLRGTGGESALDCPAGDAGNPQEDIEPLFHDPGLFAACAARLSRRADLSLYTTPIAMQDLEALRQALGYGKIELYGGSYGTRAGLVYLRMFGQHVRAAVFSGMSPIENTAPLYHAAAAQQALEAIFAQCAADAACHRAFPDPMGDVRAVMARLDEAPVPVTVSVPGSGKPARLALTAPGFADGLRIMLYSAEGGRSVPRLLAAARAGNYRPFAEAAVRSGHDFRHGLRLGLLLSVSCPEDVARIDANAVAPETADSIFGDDRVRGQMAACAVWPKGKIPDDYAAPFISTVPALILSGALDPVTPPRWGETGRRTLVASRHLVLPGAHVSGGSCVDTMVSRMFETAEPGAVDASCIDAIRLPPFEIAGGQ